MTRKSRRSVEMYPILYRDGVQEIPLPRGSSILSVGHNPRDGDPVLWVARTAEETVARHVQMFQTHDVLMEPERGRYIGTLHHGWTAWHVFERTG